MDEIKRFSFDRPQENRNTTSKANLRLDSVHSIAEMDFIDQVSPIMVEENPFVYVNTSVSEARKNDTIPSLESFLREGSLMQQHQKTKELHTISEEATFVFNPVSGKANEYEITIFEDDEQGEEKQVLNITLEQI